ncbi:MAG: hypothetical protein HC817_09710, partial [Saprospiraceae bacterium]|nr:hypothetical protein [Saprospiraceae bacterium]
MLNTILIDCPDAKGLVHKSDGRALPQRPEPYFDARICGSRNPTFFMRTEIDGSLDTERIKNGLLGVLPPDSRVLIEKKEEKSGNFGY